MSVILRLLDAGIIVAALVSSYLWWLSSRNRVRRISRHEEIDAADLNRIVTTLNRTQILNARAAVATAAASLLAGVRVILSL